MTRNLKLVLASAARRLRGLARLSAHEGGNVGPLGAMLLVPLIGLVSLATEGGNWYLTQRSMQHAADSAAIAAATNGDTGYVEEARSVASGYGYTHGTGNVTVNVINTAACPSPMTETNCYQVTVTRPVPLYLAGIVGYAGDAVVSGQRAQTVSARATARPRGAGENYCMVGLQSSGEAIRVNGGPKVDLAGCDMFSNSNLVCNGSNADTGVRYGDAVGSSSCGETQRSGQPALTDPKAELWSGSLIPPNTCGSYPQGTAGPVLASSTSWASPVKMCGDTRLTADVNVTTPNSVLVIYNGRLNLNGRTLKTSGSGSLTVIFSGVSTNGGPTTYVHTPTGSGVIDIAAPSSGDWSGVAMYQDGRLTGNRNSLNFSYSGNNPTLNIQGLVYLPNGEFSISGAINHKTGGLACLGVIARSILISGNGSIFDNSGSQCDQAGLEMPTKPGTNQRLGLVE